jgi:hypothetical protein
MPKTKNIDEPTKKIKKLKKKIDKIIKPVIKPIIKQNLKSEKDTSINSKKKIITPNKLEKCESDFCKKHVNSELKFLKNTTNELIKSKIFDEKTKEKFKLNMESKLKNNKYISEMTEDCKKTFCNPGCKGTIFQNGDFTKELEEELKKKIKGKYDKISNEDIIKMIESIKKIRNGIFKDKKSVLKHDFYIKLKHKDDIKKKGALSGCSILTVHNLK